MLWVKVALAGLLSFIVITSVINLVDTTTSTSKITFSTLPTPTPSLPAPVANTSIYLPNLPYNPTGYWELTTEFQKAIYNEYIENPIPLMTEPNITTSFVNGIELGGGINSNTTFYLNQLGINWIRDDVSASDWLSEYSLSNRYDILGIIDYQTVSHYYSSFTSLSQWNYTVTQVVNEFPNVKAFEIWNEPEYFTMGYMNGSAQNYFNMLKSAYEIIKAKNPETQVIGIGGEYSVNSFVKGVFNLGGYRYMDAASIHIHPLGEANWMQYVQNFVSYCANYSLPVWATEIGLPELNYEEITTYTLNGNEYQSAHWYYNNQSNFIEKVYPFLMSLGIDHIFYFTLYSGYGHPAGVASALPYNPSGFVESGGITQQFYIFREVVEEVSEGIFHIYRGIAGVYFRSSIKNQF